jgi:predicted exporter
VTVISSGFIAGIAACLFSFGSIHILALVFGCSLVGVAVDYALHFYCASFKNIDRFQILKTLLPAMPLGVLTSSIGYGALMLAPFPGIQQMAVLAGVGLLCTFVSVAAWGPYFIKERNPPILAEKIQRIMEKFAKVSSINYLRVCLMAVMVSIFCVGALMLSFDDDVRNYQAMDPALKIQEERTKSMLNINNTTRFLAVNGSDVESLLRTEELIAEKLDRLGVDYRVLSDLIPSQERQQENKDFKIRFSETYFPKISEVLGTDITFDSSSGGYDKEALIADADFINGLPTGWKELIHVSENGALTGRILIQGNVDADKIKNFSNAIYIDPVSEYSSLFSGYRRIMLLLVAGLFTVFAFMISAYRGITAGLQISIPVLFSILTTVGVMGLSGVNLSMFHAMGLILVLCIGIDYALFLYWRKDETGELLLLGNTLAAITTILSFGLLALSTTKAVHSFGMTVFLGIVLNFVITTLLLGCSPCKK